jgi:hypothetical protein
MTFKHIMIVNDICTVMIQIVVSLMIITHYCHARHTMFVVHATGQFKRINRKWSARWQHLSRLKGSAFFSLQKKLVVKEHNNLYLGLVMPSSG